jgi:hypothetical protein
MNTELSTVLRSTALLTAIIRPLLVIWLLSGMWLALLRSSMPLPRRMLVWSGVAVILIAWLAAVWALALHGTFKLASPGRMVAIDLVRVTTVLTLLIRSKSIAAAIDAAPAWWLVGAQGYRVAGLLFVRLWVAGVLPGSFALPAGIGDALTGLAAVGAAVALWYNAPWARPLAYGVNLFGVADLLNAITLGALSVASAVGPSPLSMYPLTLVPTFGVPIGFIIHGLSLWQLHRQVRQSTSIASA